MHKRLAGLAAGVALLAAAPAGARRTDRDRARRRPERHAARAHARDAARHQAVPLATGGRRATPRPRSTTGTGPATGITTPFAQTILGETAQVRQLSDYGAVVGPARRRRITRSRAGTPAYTRAPAASSPSPRTAARELVGACADPIATAIASCSPQAPTRRAAARADRWSSTAPPRAPPGEGTRTPVAGATVSGGGATATSGADGKATLRLDQTRLVRDQGHAVRATPPSAGEARDRARAGSGAGSGRRARRRATRRAGDGADGLRERRGLLAPAGAAAAARQRRRPIRRACWRSSCG